MLKDILKAAKAEEVGEDRQKVIPVLNRFLALQRSNAKPRYPFWAADHSPEVSRKDKRFHPSSLAKGFCERSWIINQYDLVEVEPEVHDANLLRIFGIGDAIHSMIQHWWAEQGLLYGSWACLSCGHVFWGQSPRKCEKCKQRLLMYKEVPMDDSKRGRLGHNDGEVRLVPGVSFIQEIKSMHSRKYMQSKREPFDEHVEQAVHYLDMRKEPQADEPPELFVRPTRAVLLYWNKDTSEMREFTIVLTKQRRVQFLEPRYVQMKKARSYQHPDLTTLPARPCRDRMEGVMRQCPFAGPCFKMLPPTPRKSR